MNLWIKSNTVFVMWFLGVMTLACAEQEIASQGGSNCLLDGTTVYEGGFDCEEAVFCHNVHDMDDFLQLGLLDEVEQVSEGLSCYGDDALLKQDEPQGVVGANNAPSTLHQKEALDLHVIMGRQARLHYEDAERSFNNNKPYMFGDFSTLDCDLLKAWQQRRGEWFEAKNLFPTLLGKPFNKRKGTLYYIKPAISLVLKGVPVVYDKERQCLMLATRNKDILTPRPGENFLTLLYDLYVRYKKNISTEECAYYLHESGYWHGGFHWHFGTKSQFHARIESSKRSMVVCGFLKTDVMQAEMRERLETQSELWERVRVDEFVCKAEHYGPDVMQEDVAFVEKLLDFSKSMDYFVLQNYVQSHKSEEPVDITINLIRAHVRVEPRSQAELSYFCSQKRKKKIRCFWRSMHSLASEKGPGRVVYSLETGKFFWDERESTVVEKEAYLARIFELRGHPSKIGTSLITTVLKQEGFHHAADHDVQRAYQIFCLLGIQGYDQYVQNVPQMRKIFDVMMRTETINMDSCAEYVKTHGVRIQDVSACRRLLIYVYKCYIPKLLKVCGESLAQFADPLDSQPPAKRLKTDTHDGPAKVIKEEMPTLYAFLHEQIFCKQ